MPDATALAAAIYDGRTSVRAVMEASIAACETQVGLGAVVMLDAAAGRAGARATDAQPAARRGPFGGVPFLGKDLGSEAKGLPISAGASALRARAVPPVADSNLFSAFRHSGLVPFGLTAVPPFGLALDSSPEGSTPARNPWDPSLTAGGSSGGAAAAVASGIVAIAHATDAAGSIRVPAACCGLVGLKPSRGAVAAGPEFSNHLMGIVSELVLARSVRDVVGVFDAVRVSAPSAAHQVSDRIALALPARCDPMQIAAARLAASALVEAGFEVEEIPAPDDLGLEAHAIARTILSVGLAEWLTALEISCDNVPPLIAAVSAEGCKMSAIDLFAVTKRMARISDAAVRMFANFDAVLCPVLSSPPPPVGAFPLDHTDTDKHFAKMEAFAPNAALANVTGLPALALPFGMQGKVPVGVQLWGPRGADGLLCRLASLIEQHAPALTYPSDIAGLPT
ncbi:amidase [Tateyamaria omphalii]|uniref:amidase family protein n=1 Tax=Tateyamaria omphalii TaxID=299262 RepID=UPI001C99A407|nr:amidase family protein [Tateyamaria omphalii]MBY5934895.1 amidase [Tateyamaria omphalii]